MISPRMDKSVNMAAASLLFEDKRTRTQNSYSGGPLVGLSASSSLTSVRFVPGPFACHNTTGSVLPSPLLSVAQASMRASSEAPLRLKSAMTLPPQKTNALLMR